MKLILCAINAKYIHSNLAVYDLKAYAEAHLNETKNQKPYEILIREFTINNQMEQILDSLYMEQGDVIAFSCYIWNIEYVLNTVRELRKVAPKVRIWLGGPEVSYRALSLLEQEPGVELVMIGEGEKTFAALCQGKQPEDVRGIAYRDGEGNLCLRQEQDYVCMDEIPFVYQNLEEFTNRILYYESSRGCPFRCSYCLSSIDKHVRFRSLSLVFEELQFFLNHKVPQVKFVDRTFNCDKQRARAIWKYLTEHDNGCTNFHFEIAADLIEEEDIEVFRRMRPGLIQLEIGLQSTNEETINEIRRTMDLEKLRKTVASIKSLHTIHQHLDLIAGLPYEGYERFAVSFNDVYEMQPDQLQLGFLKVLSGSYMETMTKEYGLEYRSQAPYEVLQTKWITFEQIIKLKQVEELVERYYNTGQFTRTFSFVVPKFESPFAFFTKLAEFYEKNHWFGMEMKRVDRYTRLRTFLQEYVTVDQKELDQKLLLDLYAREKCKTRPSWATILEEDRRRLTPYYKKEEGNYIHLEPTEDGYIRFDYRNRDPLTNNAKIERVII